MTASTWLGPFPTPHRTKQFWVSVGLLVLVVVCVPLIQGWLGLPPFPRRIQISSGAITLAALVPVRLAFRLGRIGWFLLALLMLAFGLWTRFHT